MRADGMTEEEMRKEIETNLNLNMFVEAGAGAGKTTLIVRRIVNMLLSGVEPGEIVVITFTNAAAEELRGRIISKVTERAKDDPKMEDKLHHMNDMNISTIHSFCNILLHEQGLVAKLPIDLEMLQGLDEIKEKKEYFDAFLNTLESTDWDDLEANMGPKGSRYIIRKNMEELYMKMVDLPEDTNIIIPEPVDEAAQKQAFEILKAIVFGDSVKGIPTLEERILSALNECIKPEKAGAISSLPASFSDAEAEYCGKGKAPFKKEISDVLLADHTIDSENTVYKLILNKEEYTFLSKGNFKAIIDKEKLEEANKKISEEINQLLTSNLREMLRVLKCKDEEKTSITYQEALNTENEKNGYGILVARYAKKAREYYRDKSKKNRITNDRLLELTRDLILNENKSALEYFSKKYTRFFVDEFQDTDRIQESFIYRLATEVNDESKLKDGALFVVGDPKQSIYRFRGAQPAVYFYTKSKMEKLDNSKVYELSYNYRSNSDVISWVNDKFEEADKITPIVDEEGISYTYQRMTEIKQAAEADNVVSGVYHLGLPDAERHIGKVTRSLKTKTESLDGYVYNSGESDDDIRNVVNLILDLTKKDKDGKGYFKITRYNDDHQPYADDIKRSDFLLISHNKKRMEAYVMAMKKSGIPVVLDGEEDMKADKGLVVYVRLYQYLVNPRDSFYRIGAEEALRETIHIKNEKELHELSERILDCLYEDAKSMSAYGMAEYLERQVSVLFDKNIAVSQVKTLSSQAHIRQMIENLCVKVTGTGIEFAEAMQEYLDTKVEHELSLDKELDAVRFMNLHKTKGLEGNIVIILDRQGNDEFAVTDCMDENRYYPGASFWTALKKYNEIQEKAKKSEGAEFHRLEYVAVTRAAQAVIFMEVLKRNGLFAKQILTGPIDKKELDATQLEDAIQNKTIYKSMDKKSYSYKICQSYNIREIINNILPKDKIVNKPYEADNPKSYTARQDDYASRKNQELKKDGMLVKESPSGLEKASSSIQKAAIGKAKEAGRKKSDEYNWNLLRPIGNVAGDILHRSMELLVGRKFVGTGTDIKSTVMQAVAENSDRLHMIREKMVKDLVKEGYTEKAEEIDEEKTKDIVTEFITSCAVAYDTYLDEIWNEVANVYPEVHFSYEEKDDNDPAVTVWMNGTADLIMEMKDGTYHLIDYKSDNDFRLTEEEMNSTLSEKYTPQLDVYRGVIQKMLGADKKNIKTGIISFSQKDKDGNIILDNKVRVRYTELYGSYV